MKSTAPDVSARSNSAKRVTPPFHRFPQFLPEALELLEYLQPLLHAPAERCVDQGGCQSNHRTAEQDHGDLRTKDHPAIPGEIADRHRGYESAEPGDPQPLRERLRETVCSRSPPATDRAGSQQRQRLRVQKSRRESSPSAPTDVLGNRQLPQCPAGYPGDVHRSRADAQTGQAALEVSPEDYSLASDTTFPSYGPRGSWREFRARGATGCCARVTQSAWSF